jgi:hypothetical protein
MATSWQLLPFEGVVFNSSESRFMLGQSRDEMRREHRYQRPLNTGRFPDEDSYPNEAGNAWIRVSFSDASNTLTEIEFLAGSLKYADIELSATSFSTLEQRFIESGYGLQEADCYSYMGQDLGINVGISYLVGGDDDSIA